MSPGSVGNWNCICGRVGIVNRYLYYCHVSLGVDAVETRKKTTVVLNSRANRKDSLCALAIVFIIWFTSSPKSETSWLRCRMQIVDETFCRFRFITAANGEEMILVGGIKLRTSKSAFFSTWVSTLRALRAAKHCSWLWTLLEMGFFHYKFIWSGKAAQKRTKRFSCSWQMLSEFLNVSSNVEKSLKQIREKPEIISLDGPVLPRILVGFISLWLTLSALNGRSGKSGKKQQAPTVNRWRNNRKSNKIHSKNRSRVPSAQEEIFIKWKIRFCLTKSISGKVFIANRQAYTSRSNCEYENAKTNDLLFQRKIFEKVILTLTEAWQNIRQLQPSRTLRHDKLGQESLAETANNVQSLSVTFFHFERSRKSLMLPFIVNHFSKLTDLHPSIHSIWTSCVESVTRHRWAVIKINTANERTR